MIFLPLLISLVVKMSQLLEWPFGIINSELMLKNAYVRNAINRGLLLQNFIVFLYLTQLAKVRIKRRLMWLLIALPRRRTHEPRSWSSEFLLGMDQVDCPSKHWLGIIALRAQEVDADSWLLFMKGLPHVFSCGKTRRT